MIYIQVLKIEGQFSINKIYFPFLFYIFFDLNELLNLYNLDKLKNILLKMDLIISKQLGK